MFLPVDLSPGVSRIVPVDLRPNQKRGLLLCDPAVNTHMGS